MVRNPMQGRLQEGLRECKARSNLVSLESPGQSPGLFSCQWYDNQKPHPQQLSNRIQIRASQPQPFPLLFPPYPPQQHRSRMIQIASLQPFPPRKEPLPFPHPPPQQHKSKIIQIMLLHPHPLSLEHPQFVAAKSLMLIASRFLFTIHSMYVACQCCLKKMRIFYH